MRLGDRDLVPHAPGRDPDPGQPADLGELRAAGEHDQPGLDRAPAGLHAGHPAGPDGHAGEGRALPHADPADGQGHRVRGHVAGRADVTVLVAVRAAAGQSGRQGRVEPVDVVRVQPADRQAERSLHLDPGLRGGNVRLGEARQQVALLGEPGVDADVLLLGQVEPPGPLAELDRPRGAALGAHDPGGAAARTLAEGPLLQQDHLVQPGLAQEVGAPAADGPAADDNRVSGGCHWHAVDSHLD